MSESIDSLIPNEAEALKGLTVRVEPKFEIVINVPNLESTRGEKKETLKDAQ